MFTLSNSNTPVITFDNTTVNFIDNHKHLGLTLSSDASWHSQISEIRTQAMKILGSMKALKFKLNRNTLNPIYISYMRPHLEYASVVWDNCTQYEKESLDKLQYEAARTVTGLTRSVHFKKLIKEIGWVSLSDRRLIQKLIIVYKARHNLLPEYMQASYVSASCRKS